jgi:hypothetical protein
MDQIAEVKAAIVKAGFKKSTQYFLGVYLGYRTLKYAWWRYKNA